MVKIKGKIQKSSDYEIIFIPDGKIDPIDICGEPAILIVKGTVSGRGRICKCGIREDIHDEMETITHDFDPV